MKQTSRIFSFLFFLFAIASLAADVEGVQVGLDLLFQEPACALLKGKKVGLITNQTGVNRMLETAVDLFTKGQEAHGFELKALFAPEHGLYGDIYAAKDVAPSKTEQGIPIFSLHGQTRRPTAEMLKGITLLVFDIQDIGSRSYTYASTLYYAMEEAAKNQIPLLVLDRPNPINGMTVDGPMLEEKLTSFLGYINVPYCHGMTIGELAKLFNEEKKIGCDLKVVSMKGYKRWMSFKDTKRSWIPTSPNIPEATTCLCYPATGFFGEMASFVSIGIGYTLPFKLVGAPWIQPEKFAKTLNQYKLPGVIFTPFRFRPLAGSWSGKMCKGVLINVTDPYRFLPVTTQYLLLSVLKELYPKEVRKALRDTKANPQTFFKAWGTYSVFEIVDKEKHPFAKLRELHAKERSKFLEVRQKYLNPDY